MSDTLLFSFDWVKIVSEMKKLVAIYEIIITVTIFSMQSDLFV